MSYLKEHDQHVAERGGWSADVVYLSSYLGEVDIDSCDRCPYLEARCIHKYNSWNVEGTILTCNLCGKEGT